MPKPRQLQNVLCLLTKERPWMANSVIKMLPKKKNQDIVGVKDDNKLTYSDTANKNAWKQHYQRFLNIEFPWDETSLSQIKSSISPAPFITDNMVLSTMQKMKLRKPPGPSNVIAEMLKASPDQCSQLLADLINATVKEGKVPEEWNNIS